MTSTQVTKKSVPGTVVAAECCYGTRLYDPSLRGIPDPVCIAYLTAGALGFLGSNFAYSPETWNGQADQCGEKYVLQREEGNPFADPTLDKLVGHSVKAERLATSGILIMRSWKTTD